jgi:hypothetical protein
VTDCEGTNAYGGKCQREARFRVTIGRHTEDAEPTLILAAAGGYDSRAV